MADPDDLYSALIGGAPTTPERQAALASALRNQAFMGNIGQASGDRVLMPLGRNLSTTAQSGAQDVASEREKQTQQAAEAKHWQDELDQKMKIAQMTDARQRELTAALIAGRKDVAETKVDAKGVGKPIPNTAKKDLDLFSDSARGVDEAITSLKALDASGIDTGGAFRNSKDWMAAKLSDTPLISSLISPQQQAVQAWDSKYGRVFTLPELKATVGLRHNQYMQELFEKYHLDVNMPNAIKLDRLNSISTQIHQRLAERVSTAQAQGYNIAGYEEHLPENQEPAGPAQPSGAAKYLPQRTPPTTAVPQPQNPLQQALAQKAVGMPPNAGMNLFNGYAGQ